ncbi:SDR family oxidoreductase [Streptomyces sp. MAI_2237]
MARVDLGVVNIASTVAHAGTAFSAPCTASRWAVPGPTRTAALELGRDTMPVNSIRPGVVSRPLINHSTVGGRLPIADFYSPAPFATGSEFVLDGGLLLGPDDDADQAVREGPHFYRPLDAFARGPSRSCCSSAGNPPECRRRHRALHGRG